MKRWSALALLLAVAGALALRLPHLATRPFHNDEAVNGIKVIDLWQNGRYAYDRDEYHGPSLPYASLPVLWLSGASNPGQLDDATLRLVPVLFGVGLILLLPLFADGLGYRAIAWAALFTAVSPAMVFYSRYFIHEIPLLFFTTLTLGAGWRYAQAPSAPWALATGIGIGLMFATKETFVITLAAMALALAATIFLPAEPVSAAGALGGQPRLGTDWLPRWPHTALGMGAALIVWLLFFSSFFRHFDGLADSIRTYLPWLKRAGGESTHIHPWSFYLERLAWFHPVKGPAWTEGAILVLATLGAGVSLTRGRSPLHRFLVFYTISLTAAYSAIPYKTPWCLIGFLHGMILLAGIGAAALLEFVRKPLLNGLIAAVLAAQILLLAWQAWRAGIEYPADRRNPYVYAQTVPDLLNLVQKAEGLARTSSAGHDTIVKVIVPNSDYWPLPWYLRRFSHVGWYDQLPADPFAPIMMVSSKLDAKLDERSGKKWLMVGISELRPTQFLELYVELELWKKYVETLPRDRD